MSPNLTRAPLCATDNIPSYFPSLPNTPPSMVRKIGKTTYLVWAHFSETSTETMEGKIKRMLREEVRQMVAGG